ncbi:unnamed protein product [Amoebophrya sp. A25]|nr:unnamed protein product [Amoebophrya sp. A25]|eukprot:GSA25T00005824001.1
MERVLRVVKLRPRPGDETGAAEDITWDSETIGVRGSNVKDLKIKVDKVLDTTVGSEYVATNYVTPLAAEVLAGVSGVFLCFGAEKTGRSRVMDGRNGLFALSLRNVFSMLEEKQQRRAAARQPQKLEFVVRISFFEICDENVRDLLRDDNQKAAVGPIRLSDTLEYGTVLDNCSSPAVPRSADAMKLLEAGLKRRYSSVSRKLITGLRIEVLQDRTIYSNLLVLEGQTTNPLLERRSVVQLRDGYDAFRSLFHFHDLVQAYHPDAVADVRRSCLTWLLKDVLQGQNAQMCCMLCVQQGEPRATRKGMEMLHGLGNIRLAPVRYDPRVSALCRAMRREMLQKASSGDADVAGGSGGDAGAAASAGAGGGSAGSLFSNAGTSGVSGNEQQKRINALEGEALTLEARLAKSENEKRRAQADLETQRRKYDETLLAFVALKKQRLQKESEKLEKARALVEMSRKFNKLEEKWEKAQYSEKDKLVNFEKEIVELTFERQKRVEEAEKLEKTLAELRSEKAELEEEGEKVKRALSLVKLERARGEGQTEELNAELAKLLAEKSESEKKYGQMSVKYSEIVTRLETLNAAQTANDDQLSTFRDRVASLKTQLERETQRSFEKGEKVEALQQKEKELLARLNTLESEGLEHEKETLELKKTAESERNQRSVKELEIERLKQEFEHVKTGMEKGFLALTKQLNPSDVFKQAGEANEWEITRLKKTVEDLELRLSEARQQMVSSPVTSPKRERREEQLHEEIKRLRHELKHQRQEQQKQEQAETAKTSEVTFSSNGSAATVHRSDAERELHDANLQLKLELEAAESRVQELEDRTRRLELLQNDGRDGGAPDEQALRQQCRYLEASVLELEQERARLLVRATSAEEQLSEVQFQMQDLIRDYEAQLAALRRGAG